MTLLDAEKSSSGEKVQSISGSDPSLNDLYCQAPQETNSTKVQILRTAEGETTTAAATFAATVKLDTVVFSNGDVQTKNGAKEEEESGKRD